MALDHLGSGPKKMSHQRLHSEQRVNLRFVVTIEKGMVLEAV